MATTKKRPEATKQKSDLTPIPNHPLKKWFGTFKNDPYWDDFLAAIKRERAKVQREFLRGKK